MTDELTDDTCDDCGFNSSERSRRETIATVERAGELIDAALGELDERYLNERPDDQTWSPLEYADHVREVFLHSRLVCEVAMLSPDRVYDGDFPPGISAKPATLGREAVVTRLREEAARNAALFETVGDDQWTNAGLVSGMRWTLRFALPHICHELLHHRRDIANRVAKIG